MSPFLPLPALQHPLHVARVFAVATEEEVMAVFEPGRVLSATVVSRLLYARAGHSFEWYALKATLGGLAEQGYLWTSRERSRGRTFRGYRSTKTREPRHRPAHVVRQRPVTVAERMCQELAGGPLTTRQLAEQLAVSAATIRVTLTRDRGRRFVRLANQRIALVSAS